MEMGTCVLRWQGHFRLEVSELSEALAAPGAPHRRQEPPPGE